jgi:hypothetical protein
LVDTALVVAVISGMIALVSAGFSWRAQLAVADRQALRDQEAREEERRSRAKVVLDNNRGPLLEAAWDLGDRINRIRNGGFLDFLGDERGQDAKLTTLFRFAQYLGWREAVRKQVQLLRFENEDDTRLVAGFLADVMRVLSNSRIDGARAMLFADELRGIGELMIIERDGAPVSVRGYATFRRDYDEVFAPWMERFAEELLTAREMVGCDRLRLLHWALLGVVLLLDEERAYRDSVWTESTTVEIRASPPPEAVTKTEARLRDRLAGIGVAEVRRTG